MNLYAGNTALKAIDDSIAEAPLEAKSSLLPRAAYVKALRGDLPARVFDRAPSRLIFVPVHAGIIVVAMCAIARGWVPWFTWPLLSIVIGMCMSGITFVSHELLHGAMVRNKYVQYAIGWLGFLPFCVSPKLWLAWHNSEHHARANLHDDPDCYPTLEHYSAGGGAKFSVDYLSFGGGRWRGVLSLLLGFTGQSFMELVKAREQGLLTRPQHRRVILETIFDAALWAALAVFVGVVPWLFIYLLPLLVANTCVMAFILTNHNLNPRVDINDPLASGLSVTTPPLIDWLTLGFGYHVEHHVFPAMSTRHAPAVRAALQARWPDRYHSMPLITALQKLHRGGRVYRTATELYDPPTGGSHPTL